MLIPQSGQAKFWEKLSSFPSTTSTVRSPSASCSAFSMESVSLRRRFSLSSWTTILSTMTSILCLIFLSSLISSESSYRLPSIRTRTYPARFARSNVFACSPFLPLTTGASIWSFVPSPRLIIWSHISSTVCLLISRPQFGQCGIPILAKRSLKWS